MNMSKTHQWTAGTALMLLMVLTRSSHAGTAVDLPDASWAVFFLAGFYLRSAILFPAFMLAAWLTDLSAVNVGGVSDFCLTPAYFMLVPAYGALWLAGLWYAGVHRERFSTIAPLSGAFMLGVAVCELFSSGGFYLFSGYFRELTWSEYLERTVAYFPSFLTTAVLYLVLAVCAHLFVRAYHGRVHGPSRDTPNLPSG